jgi:hypothetical protein
MFNFIAKTEEISMQSSTNTLNTVTPQWYVLVGSDYVLVVPRSL